MALRRYTIEDYKMGRKPTQTSDGNRIENIEIGFVGMLDDGYNYSWRLDGTDEDNNDLLIEDISLDKKKIAFH